MKTIRFTLQIALAAFAFFASSARAGIAGPIDTTTQTPVLTAPASAAVVGNPISVNFTLPEAGLPGSVTLSFGANVLTLAASQSTIGNHTFSFNPANPTGSAAVASGSPIANGVYTVTLSYQDALGNPAASASSISVLVDTVTTPPFFNTPAQNSTLGSSIPVNFTLVETALPGSVTLTFNGAVSQVLTLAPSQESAGAHNFTFDPAMPTSSPEIAIGSHLVDGTYSVTLSYRDLVGNAPATVTHTNVVLDTATLPPTLTAPASNAMVGNPVTVSYTLPEASLAGSVTLNFGATVLTLANSQGSAGPHTFSFNPSNPTASAAVVSGSPFPTGTYDVTLSYQDALGHPAASATSTNVMVQLLDLSTTALFTRGDVLQGAGTDPYIPVGATWFGFGVPAVDSDGQVAFTARWKNPPGSPGAYGSGLFVDGALRVYVGQPVPGMSGGETFKKFKDPVISGGELALIATIEGPLVISTTDTVVIRVESSGAVTVLAREGDPGTDVGGATIKSLKSVSIAGGTIALGTTGILYTATLNAGSGLPATVPITDTAAWLVRDGTTHLVVQEGVTELTGFYAPAKKYRLLSTVSGSPAQGRNLVGPVTVAFNAGASVGRSLARYTIADGLQGTISTSGVGFEPGNPLFGLYWKSLGAVVETDRVAFTAVLDGLQSSAQAKGVFVGDSTYHNFARLAYSTQTVPGAGTGTLPVGTKFKSFKDVVLASAGGGLAFPAAITGTGVDPTDDQTLWWRPAGDPLVMLAREGDTAVGDGVWKSFTSLAVPGGNTGPLFLATLIQDVAGVDSASDLGVWGVDSAGDLRLLFREGVTMVGANTVKAFSCLKSVAGSSGTTRSFNSSGQVVWRAAFVGGSQAIVMTQVP